MYTKVTHRPPLSKPPMRPLELLPASLLQYRNTWQPLVESLPNNTCLVVTSLDNGSHSMAMQRVVSSLRRQGQSVFVLSVG